jgi:quinone-modifying oxidoreductase subunit QmoA
MDKTKAIFLPNKMAYPPRYVIDRPACEPGCSKCVAACKYGAIDLDMKTQEIELEVASVVVATGWKPYDASKLTNMGFSSVPNVINNIMMERLASVSGPTKGKILRPSDQKPVESVVFVQCAGSRDENHLPYCSYICCLASLKQSLYFAEQNPEGKAYIFYIDIRTPGRYEKFLNRAKEEANIEFIKGKVADIQTADNGDLIVIAEDTISGKRVQQQVNMVVLATGMQPSLAGVEGLQVLDMDENGFVLPSEAKGMYACGCARMPLDVMTSNETATAAALKAIQTLVRG